MESFALGVTPTIEVPGKERLNWGMWSDSLLGINLYVQAYRGYDFTFDIWFVPEVGHSEGYVIATGLAFTRR